MPGFDFDTVTLTTSCGTVSLEGGGDFGPATGDHDTLFSSANSPPDGDQRRRHDQRGHDARAERARRNDSDPDGNPLTAHARRPARPTGPVTRPRTARSPTCRASTTTGRTPSPTRRSDGAGVLRRATVTHHRDAGERPAGRRRGHDRPPMRTTTVTVTVATDVDDTDLTRLRAGRAVPRSGSRHRRQRRRHGRLHAAARLQRHRVDCTVPVVRRRELTTTSSAMITVGRRPTSTIAPVAVDDWPRTRRRGRSVTSTSSANDTDADGDDPQRSPTSPTSALRRRYAVPNADGTITYTRHVTRRGLRPARARSPTGRRRR